jgi:hypothetical protein
MRDERGGIITGWLLKLVVSLAIVGVVLFEAGAVIVARVNVDSIASDAAGEAALEYAKAPNATQAEKVARDFVERRDATLVAFSVSPDGKVITLTVEKIAKTLIIQRFAATRKWTVARSTKHHNVV